MTLGNACHYPIVTMGEFTCTPNCIRAKICKWSKTFSTCLRLCAGSCLYPYYLHFDGVSREPAGHSGIGAVLTTPNQQHDFGHVSTYIGSRSSERLAKYKALLAGLDNALKCGIKCLLACGEDEVIVNQVIAYQTEHEFSPIQKHLHPTCQILL